MKNLEAINWLENWLDSASERSYQPAFVALLVRHGFSILHSTSHNLLEFGKDVIARSSDGQWFAFQLKGNPGSRFTVSQWQEHTAQLLQLCSLPFQDFVTGGKVSEYTPVLVTNGEVDEAVQTALALFNSDRERFVSSKPLVIWNRGKLLEMLSSYSGSIWPQKPGAQIALLKALVRDFRESAPIEEFQTLIDDISGFNVEKLSKASAIERWKSAYLATQIYCTCYTESGNLFESIKLKTLFLVNVICHNELVGCKDKKYQEFLNTIRSSLYAELRFFVAALDERFGDRPLINSEPFGEWPIFAARKMLIQALFAVSLIEDGDDASDEVRRVALKRIDYPYLTHEALVPAFLAVFWAKEQYSATVHNVLELAATLGSSLSLAKAGHLFSAYHSLEEVVSYANGDFVGQTVSKVSSEESGDRSQFIMPLLLLLVRRNFKRHCKLFWEDVTNLLSCEYELDEPHLFSRFRTDNGINRDQFPEIPMTWDRLIEISRRSEVPRVPAALRADFVTALLFLVFFPFRSTQALVLDIDRSVTHAWY